MSLNPGGANYNWNYSNPNKPGYSTQLVGTVIAIQEVQKLGYTMTGQPGAPEFWPDGNPKMNIRMILATEDGGLKTFVFQPAGKAARMGQKPSVHMDLFHLTDDTDMLNLIGNTICIQTEEGRYGQGNPRPWHVSLVEAGPYEPAIPVPAEFKIPQVLANNAVSGGQMNVSQQQPQWQQQQPQRQQQQQPQWQQQQWQPQQQQPQQQWQPPMQQQQQGYPQGMNPMIAQQMQRPQQQGYQQSAPVGMGQTYDDYDEDMPF